MQMLFQCSREMLECCGEVRASSWKMFGFPGEKTGTSGVCLCSRGNALELQGDAWMSWGHP